MAAARSCALAIANLVDTEQCKSAVVATEVIVARVLSAGLHRPLDPDGVIRVDRLLQRKTDIVPHIMNADILTVFVVSRFGATDLAISTGKKHYLPFTRAWRWPVIDREGSAV